MSSILQVTAISARITPSVRCTIASSSRVSVLVGSSPAIETTPALHRDIQQGRVEEQEPTENVLPDLILNELVRPGECRHHIASADDTDQFALAGHDGQALDRVGRHRASSLNQRGVGADGEQVLRHDLADGLGLGQRVTIVEQNAEQSPAHQIAPVDFLAEEVSLADHADQGPLLIGHGKATDALFDHEARGISQRRFAADAYHITCHQIDNAHLSSFAPSLREGFAVPYGRTSDRDSQNLRVHRSRNERTDAVLSVRPTALRTRWTVR